MSRRERDSLVVGDDTAPRKRGAAAFEPTDCTTWSRTKLNLHQRWEAGNLPFEEHVNVDSKHHLTWQRFQRAGGCEEGIAEISILPKTSGGNRKRESAAVLVPTSYFYTPIRMKLRNFAKSTDISVQYF